tara:strand:- start:1578 stop:1772 length:195 start_codon:yes stop_codon:yes gene_type:complete
MGRQDKWFYCLRAMESIRELSNANTSDNTNPLSDLKPEDRLEFINDLVQGTIDLVDYYDESVIA